MLRPILLATGILCALFSALTTHANSLEKLNLATFKIPHYVESDDTGVFINLTREIAKRAELDITITLYPRLRAFQFFNAQTADALFPVVDVDFEVLPIQPLLSDSFYTKTDYIFTRNGSPLLSTIEQLKQAGAVGIVLGYPYSPEIMFSTELTLTRAINDHQLVKRLLGRRIEAAIIEEISALRVIHDLNASGKLQYRQHHPISTMHTYYALPNTPTGAKLKQRISEAIAEIKRDGTYNAIVQTPNRRIHGQHQQP